MINAEVMKALSKKKSGSVKRRSYNCNECGDTTWIIVDGKARRCSCFIKSREAAKKQTNLSCYQRSKTFNSYTPYNSQTKMAKDIGISYITNFKDLIKTSSNSIAFLGQVGCGKTHLSTAVAVNLKSKKVKVERMSYREGMMEIKQNIMDAYSYSKIMNKYKRADVLVIDDLYKGKTTESELNIMFEIINYRYENMKPVVISSEKSIQDLIDMDEAVGSRLYEMCLGRIIHIKGKENNYRLRLNASSTRGN